MSSFSVLDASDPAERAQWLSLWQRWPDREVAAHPDYVSLFAGRYERPLCAAMTSADGSVLFPLILRPLTAEPWVCTDTLACDLTTPYGYGGPFAYGNPDTELFWEAFDSWGAEAHAVACFARLSLFPDQMIEFPGDVESKAPNVVRSLAGSIDGVWLDYDRKVRKNVKAGRRAGLMVEIDLDGDRLDDFLNVYYATMNRRNAADRYFFPEHFFWNLIHTLHGQFAFFHVLQDVRVVSTELVLASSKYLYSFLGGTLEEAFHLRPNDFLKHAVVAWGVENQKQAYVLGGGYGRRDGIFRYKRAFAPNGEVVFKVGKKILESAQYARLVEMRRASEHRQGNQWTPDPEYFPAYRS